jgi:hypothetical protein
MTFWDDAEFITEPVEPGALLTLDKFDELLAEINESIPMRPFTFMPASPAHLAWFCERHPELDFCEGMTH